MTSNDAVSIETTSSSETNDFVESAINPDETSEQFTARIVALVESRMRVLALRD